MAHAPHTAHDFVEDEQDAILVTDLPNALEIALHCWSGAHCGSDNRFGDKGDHTVTAETQNFVFKLLGDALPVRIWGLADCTVDILVTGRNMRDVHQDRFEIRAPPSIAAGRKRAERIAVIALSTGDHMAPLWFADFKVILPREFQGRFYGLGPSGNKVDAIQISRGVLD